jgi:hypothetical protein
MPHLAPVRVPVRDPVGVPVSVGGRSGRRGLAALRPRGGGPALLVGPGLRQGARQVVRGRRGLWVLLRARRVAGTLVRNIA